MSKLARLKPFQEPPPPTKEACASCESFAPECLVPVGDAAVPMCWLCAHHVVEHGCAPHRAATAECECSPHEIYPNRPPPGYAVQPEYMGKHSTRRIAMKHGDVDYSKPRDAKDYFTGHMYNPRTKCMETHYRGEVVASASIVPVAEDRDRRKPS